jgi:diaminohydroxyphosphoribosylaminopyrimidine deaminase/5-amino-6-(5-phosphoribosylamino)uracil reductase
VNVEAGSVRIASADEDERYMALALHVASLGRSSPAPRVGALIVRDGRVLARGYKARAGDAGAELLALAALPGRAEGARLYVSLEPPAHEAGSLGAALLRAGIAHVLIGCEDRARGAGGAAQLAALGLSVRMGVLRESAEALVADYHKLALTGLPYVTLKAAVTLDGRMAAASGDSRWVTGDAARKHVHRMRDQSDAVMIGVGTVLADDPALTVRHVRGRDPLRVVLDSTLLTPLSSQLVQSAGAVPTLIFHGEHSDRERVRALSERGVALYSVARRDSGLDLGAVLQELGRRGVMRLLVEGGPSLHGALLEAHLVDYASVFLAPRILADPAGMPLAIGKPKLHMADAFALERPKLRRFGDDVLIEGVLAKP